MATPTGNLDFPDWSSAAKGPDDNTSRSGLGCATRDVARTYIKISAMVKKLWVQGTETDITDDVEDQQIYAFMAHVQQQNLDDPWFQCPWQTRLDDACYYLMFKNAKGWHRFFEKAWNFHFDKSNTKVKAHIPVGPPPVVVCWQALPDGKYELLEDAYYLVYHHFKVLTGDEHKVSLNKTLGEKEWKDKDKDLGCHWSWGAHKAAKKAIEYLKGPGLVIGYRRIVGRAEIKAGIGAETFYSHQGFFTKRLEATQAEGKIFEADICVNKPLIKQMEDAYKAAEGNLVARTDYMDPRDGWKIRKPQSHTIEGKHVTHPLPIAGDPYVLPKKKRDADDDNDKLRFMKRQKTGEASWIGRAKKIEHYTFEPTDDPESTIVLMGYAALNRPWPTVEEAQKDYVEGLDFARQNLKGLVGTYNGHIAVIGKSKDWTEKSDKHREKGDLLATKAQKLATKTQEIATEAQELATEVQEYNQESRALAAAHRELINDVKKLAQNVATTASNQRDDIHARQLTQPALVSKIVCESSQEVIKAIGGMEELIARTIQARDEKHNIDDMIIPPTSSIPDSEMPDISLLNLDDSNTPAPEPSGESSTKKNKGKGYKAGGKTLADLLTPPPKK